MKIIGAGFAGVLCALQFPKAKIFEASSEPSPHKALMRFRSTKVSDLTGIEFKKVLVRKGIWFDGSFVEPNINVCNLYSNKVTGGIYDRSIWNIESVERYIAPDNLYEQILDRVRDRISWNNPVTQAQLFYPVPKEPSISTMPLNRMAGYLNDNEIDFKYKPITVHKYKLKGVNTHQTIYFPEPSTSLYRVSITGDILIAEYIGASDGYDFWSPFGLSEFSTKDAIGVMSKKQSYGKIAPIDDSWRKNFLYRLTTEFNIYSIGRFATWRNILLDDVCDDIIKVKKMIQVNNKYENLKELI